MPRNVEIWNELVEISPAVANLDPQPPFKVPDGYFEGLAERIMSMIRAMDAQTPAEELSLISPLLGGIDRKMPNAIPEGYFENLSASFFSRLNSQVEETVDDEIKSISPLLGSLRKKPVFDVPAGYFESLEPAVPLPAQQSAPAKIVPMGSRKTWLRYAAAAVLISFISGLGWLYFHNPNQTLPDGGVARTSPKANDSGIRALLPQVSDEALASYLDNEEDPIEPIITDEDLSNSFAILNADESDFKTLLNDIPDEEIQQYLKENPGSKDEISKN